MPTEVWDGITYQFPNFNGYTIEVWEWKSNFIPHLIMNVSTYPCWDQSYSLLIKEAPGHQDIYRIRWGAVVFVEGEFH